MKRRRFVQIGNQTHTFFPMARAFACHPHASGRTETPTAKPRIAGTLKIRNGGKNPRHLHAVARECIQIHLITWIELVGNIGKSCNTLLVQIRQHSIRQLSNRIQILGAFVGASTFRPFAFGRSIPRWENELIAEHETARGRSVILRIETQEALLLERQPTQKAIENVFIHRLPFRFVGIAHPRRFNLGAELGAAKTNSRDCHAASATTMKACGIKWPREKGKGIVRNRGPWIDGIMGTG